MKAMHVSEPVLTLEAAAAEAGWSLSTIRRLINRGRLKTHRVLSRRVITRADFDALLVELDHAAR
jgi:excisionase family DNA binding protein